jgi:hypothetical protein
MPYEDVDEELLDDGVLDGDADGHVHLTIVKPEGPPPRTRGDCLPGGYNAARPCRWITCKYWIYPLDPEKQGARCVLDVADEGGVTLEEVGAMMGITRERVRQIEFTALRRLKNVDQRYHRSKLKNLLDAVEPREGWDFDV